MRSGCHSRARIAVVGAARRHHSAGDALGSAAAVMLAAGGTVALAAPQDATLRVVGVCLGVCIVGAVGTVAAGSWQAARYALRRDASAAGCGGDCAACTLACR
jgi:hypothetical protein